ncbi:16S rRNA (guanine1207-N2)-methyltransferase [Rhodoblastus acidophilus]|uniref:16S rRNA (Guanine1207-N2)-methyltransferase n=1 Tax=Rhodoblastus acidophilus TaxID=1074 RepID=A0A212PVR8_RHOAC|nr:class I SAM-dependent methyltransferase [Rhodoblastus acidophilus]PPQ37865.1 class I SAM-dependent methyltransferase [Rhodoblastus acidophilus]RAI16587.1 class I SAM-dependent methyltransferase [Rhodoblastus acidophilus]SNB50929.1 16S rRNA (guanine1207-N2)-methyltransferase [Rhodoblastus acidophilus]
MPFDNVFGAPPSELAELSPHVRQFSPLSPGAERLEEAVGLDNVAMLAPPGAIERRAVLAMALRALQPGAPLLAMAPKDKGGGRLAKDLADLGCACVESAKRHHRICLTRNSGDAEAIEAAIRAGAPRLSETLGLWTQPGVFSWDRLDPGTALLADHLPQFSGRGADFGCGLGVLAHRILASARVKSLLMVDVDRRAVDLCARNVADSRARIVWDDVRRLKKPEPLDFVVMNPPFHDAGRENKGLGLAFIERAAEVLRSGGACWLVANRHLPYEAALEEKFRSVAPVATAAGFKVIEAVK